MPTKSAASLLEQDLPMDAIHFIPRAHIHPDPEQPRVHPDDELRASIQANGIRAAITVRPHPEIADEWMIVDGERRWRGAEGVLAEIPCVLRLDLEDPAQRVLMQLVHNTGKPLTPLEWAKAVKRALDAGKTQQEIADTLGKPRSTIGDYARMLDNPEPWLALLEAGKLQPSHMLALHPFAPAPLHVHEAVIAEFKESYLWGELEEGGAIRVDEFGQEVGRFYTPHLHPLDNHGFAKSELPPRSYSGPVVKAKFLGDARQRLYAADPEIWRPLVAAARKERAAADRADRKPGTQAADDDDRAPRSEPRSSFPGLPPAAKTVKQKGYDSERVGDAMVIVDDGKHWAMPHNSRAFDVDVFLARSDDAQLVRETSHYGADRLATNDHAAYEAAREAWVTRWQERRAHLRAELAPSLERFSGSADAGLLRAALLHVATSDYDGGAPRAGGLRSYRSAPVAAIVDCAIALGVAIPEALETAATDNDGVEAVERWLEHLSPPDVARLAWPVLGVLATHLPPDGSLAGVLGDRDEPIPLPSIVAIEEEDALREVERKKLVPWTRKAGRGAISTHEGGQASAPARKNGKRQRKPLALGQPSPDTGPDDDAAQVIRAALKRDLEEAADMGTAGIRVYVDPALAMARDLEEATADA